MSWHENAIIYGVDIGTFQDGNGDGIGDFAGATSRLPYLADLGVTCLWVLPFYPTPNRDNGYDIADYFQVDSRLGTLDDFTSFVREAKRLGMRVMSDLVVNHTSRDHPWFQAARRDPESRYREFYIWTEDPPPTPPGEGPIFPGEETSVWSYDDEAKQFFYHRFYDHEPELNASDPHVQEAIRGILDYWLSFGVNGFRVDAASHLIAQKGPPEARVRAGHEFLKDLHSFVTRRKADAVLMAEADEDPDEVAAFFGDSDEMHLLLNFLLANYLFLALARRSAEPARRLIRLLPYVPENAGWANFLRNLDELDLERLSEEERQEVFEAFAPEESMRIFGRGIRRRLAPMLEGDPRRIRLAYSLLFALPGAPVIMYGDEIGMGDDLDQPGRNAVRSPMQWSSERNAGFSDTEGELVQPVIEKGPFSFREVNVRDQSDDPESLLSWMKRLIALRRKAEEIGSGEWDLIETESEDTLALWYRSAAGDLLTVHNLAAEPRPVRLRRELLVHASELRPVFSSAPEDDPSGPGLPEELTVEGFGYRWFRTAE